MRLLLAGALVVVGQAFVAGPVAAAPNCDVPDPPPICGPLEQPVNQVPTGALGRVTRVPAGLSISGTATDPDDPGPVTVAIRVSGVEIGRLTTDASGTYSGTLPARAGSQVTAMAFDRADGKAVVIGTRNLGITLDPIGVVDEGHGVPGGFRLRGWALDQDTTSPIAIHVYVDGVFAGGWGATGSRPDVGAAYPGYGDAHGYDVFVPVPVTQVPHTIQVYALNAGPGSSNPMIGSRSHQPGIDPIGFLDVVTPGPSGVRVAGWTLDPETTDQIDVRITVNGVAVVQSMAHTSRPDVAAAYPGYGDRHGFDVTVQTRPGSQVVCAYGVNVANRTGASDLALLGCQTVLQGEPPNLRLKVFAASDGPTLHVRYHTYQADYRAVSYRLTVAEANGSSTLLASGTLTAAEVTYNDTGLAWAQQRCYTLTADNAYGSDTTTVCGTTLLAPLPVATEFGVSAQGRWELTLSWMDNADDEDGYTIAETNGWPINDYWRVAGTPGTGRRSFKIIAVSPGGWYCYSITPHKVGRGPTTPVEICAATLP